MNRHPSPEMPPQKVQLVYSRLQNEPRCGNRNVAFLLDLQQIALFSLSSEPRKTGGAAVLRVTIWVLR